MKSFRIKIKTIHLSFSNIKKMVGATILLSVLFVSPGVIADTNKRATGIITTIKGTAHLHHTGHQIVPNILILNKEELLRKKYPPLSPERIRLNKIEYQKLPIIAPATMKMILPNNQQECASIDFNGHDLNADTIDESYKMVSLLNCNERNYVTPVRSQQGDTCEAYSSTAVIESYLGVLLDSYRPDYNKTDFLSINLSAGYGGSLTRALTGPAPWRNEQSGCCISSMRDWFGTTLEAYYPDSEFLALWDTNNLEQKKKKLAALSAHYSSINECKNLRYTNKVDFYSQMKDCLLSAAQWRAMLFVNVDKVGIVKGNTYEEIDANIKSYIQQGHAVEASVNWRVDTSISPPAFLYQNYALQVLLPSNATERYGHAVAIVGYLEGSGNTQDDYWIIKNSHSDRHSQRNLFRLIQTPSTTPKKEDVDSTKRIFRLPSYNYRVVESLRFYRFKNNLENPTDINYTDTVRLHDSDGDEVIDWFDNCPRKRNPDQNDSDGDNVGDKCDYCPMIFDFSQKSSNINLPGNDTDGDSIPNICDNCPNHENTDQIDIDGDGAGDVCDVCPNFPNSTQIIKPDTDGDGVQDDCDNCKNVANPNQINTDNDNNGDRCDLDDDNDNISDFNDNCPLDDNQDQKDSDGDSIGDVCDKCPATPAADDKDNDCALDSVDNCPESSNRNQQDSDHDGVGDTCDNCPDINNSDGQDSYKIIRSRCGGKRVRVPVDCQTTIERLYGTLCDFIKGVEISEYRLRELDLQRIKDFNPALPPTGGSQPWKDSSNINTVKNEQAVFKGVNETVLKQGMKELRIQSIYLEQLKVKASGVIRK